MRRSGMTANMFQRNIGDIVLQSVEGSGGEYREILCVERDGLARIVGAVLSLQYHIDLILGRISYRLADGTGVHHHFGQTGDAGLGEHRHRGTYMFRPTLPS